MSNVLSNSHRSAGTEVIPFFHELPTTAIASAARLWDEAQSVSYNGQTAYQDFAQDLRFLHIEPPPRAIVRRWIAGVQANLIPRPGGEIPVSGVVAPQQKSSARPVAKGKEERQARRVTAQEKLAAALPEFTPVVQNLPPIAPTSEIVGADVSIEMFATRLFDDTVASLNRDVAAKAAKVVASRLREIADRYDASAA